MGLQGGLNQMLAHGINVVGLFYVCQILFRKFHDHDIHSMGGIRTKAPLFAGLFLVILLASVALPLTNAFPGEFMLLNSYFRSKSMVVFTCRKRGYFRSSLYVLSLSQSDVG